MHPLEVNLPLAKRPGYIYSTPDTNDPLVTKQARTFTASKFNPS